MTVSSRVRRSDASQESPKRYIVSAPPFAKPTSVAAPPFVETSIFVREPPFVEYVVVEPFDAARRQLASTRPFLQNDAAFAIAPVSLEEIPFDLAAPFDLITSPTANAAPVVSKPAARPVEASKTPPALSVSEKSPSNPASAAQSQTPRSQTTKLKSPRLSTTSDSPSTKNVASVAEIAQTLKTIVRNPNDEANLTRLSAASSNVVASPAFFRKLSANSPPVDGAAKELDFLREPTALQQVKKEAPGWASSVVVHVFLILFLAFLATNATPQNAFELVSEPGLSEEFTLDEVFDPETAFEANEIQFDTQNTIPVESDVVADAPEISAFNEQTAAPLALPDDSFAVESIAAAESNVLGALGGDDLSGRGADKAAALATGGGSEGSEKSVALALAWLAEHQLKDGSWSFQLQYCPNCGGACTHSGQGSANNAPFAATSMALLPFLAAGHTPTQGKYKKIVAKGIRALLENANSTDVGLDLRDANRNAAMYSHGLATIALCEAFAMQEDREKGSNPRLGYAAQDAIRFIESCQDPYGGGWRYAPREAGDTSVGGWQIMALKSALMGGLTVDDSTGRLALKFLRETVAFDGESRYGYSTSNDGSAATTSAGLLCRLYLDWRTDNPAALAGADWLLGVGPDLSNPYYNYYATQFLHHIGGERWERWNSAIRDPLIASQSLEGHERGSWYPANADGHCQTGGRLYATSLNCMILEVYYRHMPLYRKLEGAAQFPLEPPHVEK